ncbi:MAG: NepR family anti-sigma factor [Sphingomicrobium sp.]
MSAKKRDETEQAGESAGANKAPASDRSGRKHRSGDLGRALRSVYDDTVRETVPDDFLKLIGKLD